MAPGRMRAVQIVAPGGPEALQACERDAPRPGPGEVLIAVEAAGVNRPDILQREGRYSPPPGVSDLPGLEVAGRIVEAGPGAVPWRAGDAVCALLAGGGYAESCVAPAVQCLPVPAGMSMVEAAALPETFFTVWSNVFERGRLAPGEWLLVHGGTSGIGTTAIQLAHALGSRVAATAAGKEKCAACVSLGADVAIDRSSEDFVARVREATAGRGVDVILDMVGGDYMPRNLDCLALDGRLVEIAHLRGATVSLSIATVMQKRLTITGSTLRPRSPAEKGAIARELRERVWPLLERGLLRPVIAATLPLERAADAHRLLEEGRHVGKVVLTVG